MLADELMLLCNRDTNRFLRFYQRVTNLIASLPIGSTINLANFYRPPSQEVFVKIVILFIIDYEVTHAPGSDYYEFVDRDLTILTHKPGLTSEEKKFIEKIKDYETETKHT